MDNVELLFVILRRSCFCDSFYYNCNRYFMAAKILIVLIFVFAPVWVLRLCRKYPFFEKIGPVLILYILGVIIGNLPWINEGTYEIKNAITTVMIPLALPMMLFGCSFNKKDMKGVLRSLLAGILGILVSVICGFLLFGKYLGEDGPAIAALLTGCETGGTINMAALQQALEVPSEQFLLLNTYDMIICFLYFIFLLSFGIKWFRKLLPVNLEDYSEEDEREIQAHIAKDRANPYKGLWSKKGITQIIKILIAVVIVCGLSYAATLLFPKNWFMPVFIMMLTTLALAASFTKPVKKMDKSFDIGMYLIYIFSIAMASMADLLKLNLREGIYTFLFLFFIIFISLFLQLLFSKLFKVDADMMIASSVSLINSPPFVPMVVTAMKNKRVLVPGITIGLIGFAIGNYLGMLLYNLFSLM